MGYYSLFVRADGNDPVKKENLIMHERGKTRVKSVILKRQSVCAPMGGMD